MEGKSAFNARLVGTISYEISSNQTSRCQSLQQFFLDADSLCAVLQFGALDQKRVLYPLAQCADLGLRLWRASTRATR